MIRALLPLWLFASCSQELPVDTRGEQALSEGPSEENKDEFTGDEEVNFPSNISGSFLVGVAIAEDKTTPVANATVYAAGLEEYSVKTDAAGKFKIKIPTSNSLIDLIIMNKELGLGRILSDVPVSNVSDDSVDLGNIILESTGAVKGRFLINAEDHPLMERAGRSNLLSHRFFNVEIWEPGKHGSKFNAASDADGTFLVRGIPPGIWDVKFFHEHNDYDFMWDGFIRQVEVKAGRTTVLQPGSAVQYDNEYFAAIISDVNKEKRELSILNLSQTWGTETTHVSTFDKDGNVLSNYVEDFVKKVDTVVKIPENATTLKISYRSKIEDDNGYVLGMSNSPLFNFEINFDDRDGDGFDDQRDCAPDDPDKYYFWTNIVKDHDGDGYYPPPEENLCGGFDFPDGYVLVQDDFRFDCDDTDKLRYQTKYLTDSNNKKYPICTGPSIAAPTGYTSGNGYGDLLLFDTDPAKADIYFFSAYEFSDVSVGAGEIILPPLTKDTYIYFVSYHSPFIKVLTNGGENFLKGVYRLSYDPKEAVIVENLTTGDPYTVDTNDAGLGYYPADGFSFQNWYKEDYMGEYNYARTGMIALPRVLNGEVRALYGVYNVGGPIDTRLWE